MLPTRVGPTTEFVQLLVQNRLEVGDHVDIGDGRDWWVHRVTYVFGAEAWRVRCLEERPV